MPPKNKKGSRSGVEMDPAVNIVKGMLEQNVTFFVQNVSQFINKYQENLTECINTLSAKPSISLQLPPSVLAKSATAAVEAAPEGVKADQPVAAPVAAAPVEAAKEAAVDPAATDAISPTMVGKVVISATEEADVIEVEFPDNEQLCKQLKALKREAYELSTTFDGISDWIDLNAPDKEKGAEDSIGAEVQDAVIEQVGSLNEAVKAVYDLEYKYLSDRADLETQVLKAPQVRSLQLQLEIWDADMWDEVERSWRAMIRVCLILYSVLTKNMNRLKNPDGPKSLTGYH